MFHSFGKSGAQQRSALKLLAQYAQWRNLPHPMHMKVKQYMQYTFDNQHGMMETEQEILESLSPTLKCQACAHIYGPALRGAPFLVWVTKHDVAFEALLAQAAPQIWSQGDVIFEAG